MKGYGNWKLLKWAAVPAAACLFFSLAVDWVQPGEEARLAAEWLGMPGREGADGKLFPLWGWLVGLAGKDVHALGWVSAGAGFVCVLLVSLIFRTVFNAAVWIAQTDGFEGENAFPHTEDAGVLLSGLAFALTPGLLAAATRVSPLMVVMVPPLAVAAVVVPLVVCCTDVVEMIDRFRQRWYLVLPALISVGYSAYELVLARRVILPLAWPALGVWFAAGVMPALLIAGCVSMRWLVGRKAQRWAFGGWAAAILLLGGANFMPGTFCEGRAANRFVTRIVANAVENGKAAVVSDGTFDELYFFLLPEGVRLISLAREYDPVYGRELSDWVRKEVKADLRLDQIEDLAFAAEMGPLTLIDEWAKLDRQAFETKIATMTNYFPTREKWVEACDELKGMRSDEPLAVTLRRLVAVCGNALGCRLIEQGDLESAWAIFKAVVDEVEPTNYAACLNLQGMVERGYTVPEDEADRFAERRRLIENELKDLPQVVHAAQSGGRVYVDPAKVAEFEREKRERTAKRGLSSEARAFAEAVAAAPKDPKRGRAAQEAIHKAIREGKVRADVIGGQLIAIDLALGDRESVEKDAIGVLKIDRHDPTANAALGSLAMERGDYERAERYLRRAVATGKASVCAKNDLAWTLCRLGRMDEAESFAREAVGSSGETWFVRETLASVLIRKGLLDDGERELEKAEELAEKSGIPKEKVASFEIDRARIFKARGDYGRLKPVMRRLKSRKDLTAEQREAVEELD